MSVSVTDLYPYLKEKYDDQMRNYEFNFEKVFTTKTSNRSTENYLENSMTGLVPQTSKSQAFPEDDIYIGNEVSLTAQTYKLQVPIAKEDLEDENYGIYDTLPSSLAKSVQQTAETDGFNVLNNAFDSGVQTGGDGKELCATDHVLVSGGSWSNEMTTPAQLSMTSFETAMIDLMNMPNSRGLNFRVQPKRLLVSPTFHKKAMEITGSIKDPESAQNAINPYNGSVEVVATPYLTNTNYWFLTTDVEGLLCQKRKFPAEFENATRETNGDALFRVRYRLKFGWSDPRSIYGVAAT
jgi:phage major head subunit gpT-like protein